MPPAAPVAVQDAPPAKVGGIRPIHIDGALWTAIGTLTAFMEYLSTDAAAKHVAPDLLWWLQVISGSVNGGLMALKLLRDTTYADSKK